MDCKSFSLFDYEDTNIMVAINLGYVQKTYDKVM